MNREEAPRIWYDECAGSSWRRGEFFEMGVTWAISSGRPRSRPKHRPALTVLQVAVNFAVYVPLWWPFSMTLAHLLGIPDDAPAVEQPYGWLWFGLVMVEMVGLLIAGWLLAEFVTATLLHLALGFSWEKLRAIDVCQPWIVDWLEHRGSERSGSLYDADLDGRAWSDGQDPPAREEERHQWKKLATPSKPNRSSAARTARRPWLSSS